MNMKMENTLRDRQLASVGKLLAGYTHELKNHLAIINESSGLMADLLDMTLSEDEKTRLRFKKIITTIGERIQEANDMANHLNNFAHRMDTSLSNFNINDLLIEELALIDRVARLKNIQLEVNLQDNIPSIYNNPSLFQFIIFTLIQEITNKLASGNIIKISSSIPGQTIHVSLNTSEPLETTPEASETDDIDEMLKFVAAKMNIGINQTPSASYPFQITLTLPST